MVQKKCRAISLVYVHALLVMMLVVFVTKMTDNSRTAAQWTWHWRNSKKKARLVTDNEHQHEHKLQTHTTATSGLSENWPISALMLHAATGEAENEGDQPAEGAGAIVQL